MSRLKVGDTVVSGPGKLTDPFVALTVTAVHKDGTVDVADSDTRTTTWTHVHPRDLQPVARH